MALPRRFRVRGGPHVPTTRGGGAAPGSGLPVPESEPAPFHHRAARRPCGGCRVADLLSCWRTEQSRAWRCLARESAAASSCLRLPVGSDVTRADLAHEILVRAFEDGCRSLRRARPETLVGHWARGVARNLLRKVLAAKRLRPLDGLDPPAARCEPADRLAALDEQAVLTRALDTLPAKQRLVARLARHGLAPGLILEVHRGWEPTISARTVRWRTQRTVDELGAFWALRPESDRAGERK